MEDQVQKPKRRPKKTTTEPKVEKPSWIAKFDEIPEGWYRATNVIISQVTDPSYPNGFKDKIVTDRKKTTRDFLIRFPRFAARQRNMWTMFNYTEEEREVLLKLRARECMELDKKTLAARLDYLESELGMDVRKFRK